MARKKIYNHNRFDGGMTDNPRDTLDLTKMAFISHLDIYRDPNQMYVLPGYIDDMSIGGDADGMKLYDIRAMHYVDSKLFAVGTKSDGTGSKVFFKDDPTDTNWQAATGGEGTDNLAAETYLVGTTSSNLFYSTVDTTTNVSKYDGASVTDNVATIIASVGTPNSFRIVAERAFDNIFYANKGGQDTGVSLINGATFTLTQKTTGSIIQDIQTADDTIGLFGSVNYPSRCNLLIWDSASLLIDQNIDFGLGRPAALGYPAGVWVGVVNEGVDIINQTLLAKETNRESMAIKAAVGTTSETLYRLYAPTNTNGKIMPVRAQYFDAFLFYARIPADATPTEYREGLWAVGKNQIDSPLAISIPFDTTSLGSVEKVYQMGTYYYLIHSNDGSISRVDTLDGTYDVPGTIETLIYGADSPYQKELDGVSIITENIPASASVQVEYRTDIDTAWVSMGTSSTTNKQKHNFTRIAGGTPIGKFQEIQFRITFTGKIVVKNILVATTETDELPFAS